MTNVEIVKEAIASGVQVYLTEQGQVILDESRSLQNERK